VYLADILLIALLVVLSAKCEVIDPIVEYLKLLPVLAERLRLYYLTVLTDKAKK
jgi:hypothetical protein